MIYKTQQRVVLPYKECGLCFAVKERVADPTASYNKEEQAIISFKSVAVNFDLARRPRPTRPQT